jgi:RNA polymerase sigma-70 factor (ECF subfamily)
LVSIAPLRSAEPGPGGEPDRWPAFEALVREQYPALCGYAYRYAGDRDVAEEIVQDVLFRVWRRRDWIPTSDLLPYVYRSIAHAAISRGRTDRAIRTRNARLRLEAADPTDPECPATAGELETRVRDAIESLPERCRLVFLLSRDAGLTYPAIAERLGIAPKTVENQIVKALKLLRAALLPLLGASGSGPHRSSRASRPPG